MEAVLSIHTLSRFVAVVAVLLVSGCATHTPPDLSASAGARDVSQEHPRLNLIADICADRDTVWIITGLAIFGGVAAAIASSD